MIYLDNAASTRPLDDVVALMAEVMREAYGNPSSAHPLGAAARRHIATARARLLAAIGDPDGAAGDLIWTSGGTESDALGLLGAAAARPGAAVLCTALEHDAVIRTAERLGGEVVPAPGGAVDVERVLDAVTSDTGVVALMRVQNELGTLQPVAEIARAVHARAPECHVHCDAVQALGKIPLDVVGLGVDSAAFAAHKLHGPKGVGALWVRHGARIEPLWGGGGQQGGVRSGTQDAPGVAGMGLAAERAVAALPEARARWTRFAGRIRAAAAAAGVEHTEVPPGADRAPHVLPIAFRGIPAAALRSAMASRGVAVSSGSACAERDAKPSRVLEAAGLGPDWGMVRVSFGHDTTDADVARAAEILASVVADLAPRTS